MECTPRCSGMRRSPAAAQRLTSDRCCGGRIRRDHFPVRTLLCVGDDPRLMAAVGSLRRCLLRISRIAGEWSRSCSTSAVGVVICCREPSVSARFAVSRADRSRSTPHCRSIPGFGARKQHMAAGDNRSMGVRILRRCGADDRRPSIHPRQIRHDEPLHRLASFASLLEVVEVRLENGHKPKTTTSSRRGCSGIRKRERRCARSRPLSPGESKSV